MTDTATATCRPCEDTLNVSTLDPGLAEERIAEFQAQHRHNN